MSSAYKIVCMPDPAVRGPVQAALYALPHSKESTAATKGCVKWGIQKFLNYVLASYKPKQ